MNLADALITEIAEQHGDIRALRVTPERRTQWLTGAGPDDRWAAVVGDARREFAYGRTLLEAVHRAAGPI